MRTDRNKLCAPLRSTLRPFAFQKTSPNKFGDCYIKTEAENDKFLKIVEELLSRPNITPEENTLLELFVKLISDFEEKHYQLNTSTPHSRLLHFNAVTDTHALIWYLEDNPLFLLTKIATKDVLVSVTSIPI